MAKEVSMSIKLERELRDEFSRAAAEMHRPAAQLIRELMRGYLARRHEPNAETIAAFEELDNGGGTRFSTVEEMFRECGV